MQFEFEFTSLHWASSYCTNTVQKLWLQFEFEFTSSHWASFYCTNTVQKLWLAIWIWIYIIHHHIEQRWTLNAKNYPLNIKNYPLNVYLTETIGCPYASRRKPLMTVVLLRQIRNFLDTLFEECNVKECNVRGFYFLNPA